MSTSLSEPGSTAHQSHSIRITSQGKIKNYVAHALQFFKENKHGHLILHTLPPPPPPVEAEPSDETTSTQTSQREMKVETKGDNKGLSPCTTTIPKLITVVEIIKREYLKSLNATSAARIHGLHQYNHLSNLEEEHGYSSGNSSAQRDEVEALKMALEGKNHLKRRQTPFMRITLSPVELPGLELNGASYQKPATRNISKSARKRARKRDSRVAEAQANDSASGDEVLAAPGVGDVSMG